MAMIGVNISKLGVDSVSQLVDQLNTFSGKITAAESAIRGACSNDIGTALSGKITTINTANIELVTKTLGQFLSDMGTITTVATQSHTDILEFINGMNTSE